MICQINKNSETGKPVLTVLAETPKDAELFELLRKNSEFGVVLESQPDDTLDIKRAQFQECEGPLPRKTWIPCPRCGADYDGIKCHGCNNRVNGNRP